MIKKFKKFIANLLWKIAGISPEMGNLVMDILGYDKYLWVMKNQSINGKIEIAK